MYILKRIAYLDKSDEMYKNIIAISPKPRERELLSITKLLNRESISPFKQSSGCHHVILNPENTSELLYVDDITLLFNYIFANGFRIDNDTTKVLQHSCVKMDDLICFITK